MEVVDILKYWEKKLTSDFSAVSLAEHTLGSNREDKNRASISIEKIAGKLNEITRNNQDMGFIIFQSAVLLMLHSISGKKMIGINVGKNGRWQPLLIEIPVKGSIKDFLNLLISENNELSRTGWQEDYLRYLNIDLYKAIELKNFVLVTMGHFDGNNLLHFDLTKDQITFNFMDSINKDTATGYLNYIFCIMEQITESLTINMNDINIFDQKELDIFLHKWQGSKRVVQESLKLSQLFDEVVMMYENETALIYNGRHYTYGELGNAVFNMAIVLRNNQVEHGDKVAVVCTPEPQTICTIIAISYIGAVYVPLDHSWPAGKVQYILADSQAEYIILSGEGQFEGGNAIKAINAGFNIKKTDKKADPDGEISKNFYLIYTSGSTGNPKGVMIDFSQFTNLNKWYSETFDITLGARVLLLTNFGFDASVKNIFTPLLAGAALVLPHVPYYDSSEINKIIKNEKITHINCVPSLFTELLESARTDNYRALRSLEHVILGGEKFNINPLIGWRHSENCRAVASNVYGPTEGTDISTSYFLKEEDYREGRQIPIGRPIFNRTVFVLNEADKLCPPGITGRLNIGGTGVINQYWHREQASDVFAMNPYLPGQYMYATGDLVKWDKEGNLIFTGRSDNQVKINGQRVELEEIEQLIAGVRGVRQAAAVISKHKNCNGQLIAYVQTDSSSTLEADMLRNYCMEWIQETLVPKHFVFLEEFPLNSNGKIDRKKLSELEVVLEDYDLQTRNDLEEAVMQAYLITLNIDQCPVNKPFFELGGNSLLLNKLKIEINERTKHDIDILDFFEYPTIELLAEYIETLPDTE